MTTSSNATGQHDRLPGRGRPARRVATGAAVLAVATTVSTVGASAASARGPLLQRP
jgi:hypothetical protein